MSSERAKVDLTGVITTPSGQQWQAWGRARRGTTEGGADVRWLEVLVPPEPMEDASWDG